MISNARGAHIIRAKITILFQRKKHISRFIHYYTPVATTTISNIEHILNHSSHSNKTNNQISKTTKNEAILGSEN